jgi:hypothetical protein
VGGIINYSAGGLRGPVAQLGARQTGSLKVRGSNPLGSTTSHNANRGARQPVSREHRVSAVNPDSGDQFLGADPSLGGSARNCFAKGTDRAL